TLTRNGQSGTTASQTVTNGSLTTAPNVALPTATLTVTVNWAAKVAIGATVTVSGGPAGSPPMNLTGTTNASGIATITVPQTNSSYPYTVTASLNGGSGSSSV